MAGVNKRHAEIVKALGDTVVKQNFIPNDLNTIFELAYGIDNGSKRLRTMFLEKAATNIIKALEKLEDEGDGID